MSANKSVNEELAGDRVLVIPTRSSLEHQLTSEEVKGIGRGEDVISESPLDVF